MGLCRRKCCSLSDSRLLGTSVTTSCPVPSSSTLEVGHLGREPGVGIAAVVGRLDAARPEHQLDQRRGSPGSWKWRMRPSSRQADSSGTKLGWETGKGPARSENFPRSQRLWTSISPSVSSRNQAARRQGGSAGAERTMNHLKRDCPSPLFEARDSGNQAIPILFRRFEPREQTIPGGIASALEFFVPAGQVQACRRFRLSP